MATPQDDRRRLEEQKRKAQQNNKPPAVGTKRADGKVYSGQNYGFQSPATHKKLKDQGKFKQGAQALDRASQSIARVIPKPIKDYAASVQRTAATQAEADRKQREKHPVGRLQNKIQNRPNATERVLQAASDKTNVDRRIVDTAATVAQSVVSKKLLAKGAVKGAVKPKAVAAAPTPPTPPANRNLGRRLGGTNRSIKVRNLEHGTSSQASSSIRSGGYKESTSGAWGKGVYMGPRMDDGGGSQRIASRYADGAARRNYESGNGARIQHRVPDSSIKKLHEPTISPERSAARAKRDHTSGTPRALEGRDIGKYRRLQAERAHAQGKGTRDGNVYNLPKDLADRTRVKQQVYRPTPSQVKTVERNRPARSVGAAGKPPVNPAKPQPGARLGGPNQKIKLNNTYHGTSNRAADSIRQSGYRPSATGVYGPGVYTGNKAMAKQYATSAGIADKSGGRVLRHRVPAKNQATVPFEKPEARQRVSPQSGLVQQRLKEGKTTKIDYGKGSQVTNLTKAQADKTLVKPNGQIPTTKKQVERLRASRVATGKTQETQVGRRLGGDNKTIAQTRLYHGTSPEGRAGIESDGFRKTGGMFGPGSYTGSNRNIARTYATDGKTDRNVVRLRVPRGAAKSTDKAVRTRVDDPDNYNKVSSQSNRLASDPSTKAVRVRNIAPASELRNVKGVKPKGSNRDYYVLNPDYASKKIVRGPNNKFYPTKGQAANVNAREKYGKGQLDNYVRENLKTQGDRPYVDRRLGNRPKPATSQRLGYDNVANSEGKYFRPGRRPIDTEQAARHIEAQLKKNPGGFTVNPRNGRNPTRGSQVAIDGRVLRDTSPEGIRRFVEKNKEILSRPDARLGGWKSERSGKPVIELSRRVRNPKEAARLGKKFQQEATWDNKAGQYTPTGGNDQLKFTKGNSTAGGSRIGGQLKRKKLPSTKAQVLRTNNPPARSVGAAAPKPSPYKAQPGGRLGGPDQRTKGPRSASFRKTNATKPKTDPKPYKPKNFTPARRAMAVQRANDRQVTALGGRAQEIENNAIGLGGQAIKSRFGSAGESNHSVAFHNSRQKLKARFGGAAPSDDGHFYSTRRELGDKPQSKARQKLNEAGLKDMMARLMDIPKGDNLLSQPTSKGRNALYRRATKGAHGTRKKFNQDDLVSRRVSNDIWANANDDRKVRFDPRDLRQALQRLTEGKTIRLGRQGGGTSKIQTKASKPKNTVTNKAMISRLKQALAEYNK